MITIISWNPLLSYNVMNSAAKKKKRFTFERKATTSIHFKLLKVCKLICQNDDKVKCCTSPRSAFCELIPKLLNVQFSECLFFQPILRLWISHHIWFVQELVCSRAQGQLHLHHGFIIVLWAPAQQNWQQKTITDNKAKISLKIHIFARWRFESKQWLCKFLCNLG